MSLYMRISQEGWGLHPLQLGTNQFQWGKCLHRNSLCLGKIKELLSSNMKNTKDID